MNASDFCLRAQVGVKHNVDQPKISYRLNFTSNLDPEIAFLPEKLHERIFRLLHIGGRVGRLRVVFRNLKQPCVAEVLKRAGKLVRLSPTR